MLKQYSLSREQRLRSKKQIDELFTQGRAMSRKPVRLVWNEAKDGELLGKGVQVLVSVSKRNFKRANMRNLLKRRMREAWRLKSVAFCQFVKSENLHLSVALIYAQSDCVEYAAIEHCIVELIDKLDRQLRAAQLHKKSGEVEGKR